MKSYSFVGLWQSTVIIIVLSTILRLSGRAYDSEPEGQEFVTSPGHDAVSLQKTFCP